MQAVLPIRSASENEVQGAQSAGFPDNDRACVAQSRADHGFSDEEPEVCGLPGLTIFVYPFGSTGSYKRLGKGTVLFGNGCLGLYVLFIPDDGDLHTEGAGIYNL